MQSNCLREASKACFNACCAHPLLLPPPPPHASPPVATPRRDFVSAILSTIHPHTNFTNHESLPSSNELLSHLKTAIPNYLNTILADSIRAQEYYHFNLNKHVCLDYVGHGLFSYAQRHGGSTPPVEAASTSAVSTSAAPRPFFEFSYSSMSFTSYLLYAGKESEFEAAAKRRILKYMNLLEDDYSLIFTPNQSSAFKLLAHSYPFQSHPNLVSVYDYDNEALQLMIEAAGKLGGRANSAVFSWPSLRVNSGKLRKILVTKNKPKNRGLLAFPLQSRMTGARYSYQWMNMARENGWHVLLDASALAAKEMETLGLSLFQPDFLICSFFEIFGENPSGFCCLFVKKSSISILNQSSTNMGIINLVPTKNKLKSSAIDNEADLDTTPSSSSSSMREAQQLEERKKETSEIVEVHDKKYDQNDVVLDEVEFRCLDHADALGLIVISSRLRYLTNWLVNALLSLQHPHSGLALITLYGPRIRLDRGPAVAFNVHDWRGEKIEPVLVQKLADRNNISLSIGFLKNICFSEDKERFLEEKKNMKKKKKKSKEDCGVGVVSANLGMLSNFEDVYRFWAFVSRFLDADFVEKEKWRYTALNQTTVEV